MKKKTQTFNDGILTVYSAGNTADDGNMPKEGLTKKVGPLRFEERIVGMSRFWDAKQSKVEINRLLRVPRNDKVSSQDVVILIGGDVIPENAIQHEIKQVQYVKGVEPPSMDLSLELLEANYEVD